MRRRRKLEKVWYLWGNLTFPVCSALFALRSGLDLFQRPGGFIIQQSIEPSGQ